VQTGRMLIDGAWVQASGGAEYAVPNPATEEIIGKAPDASVADVEKAIVAARRAFDEGPWPRSTPRERARAIDRIADGLERRKEELRAILVAETGATYMTHEVQLEAPIQFMRNFASLAASLKATESFMPRSSSAQYTIGWVSESTCMSHPCRSISFNRSSRSMNALVTGPVRSRSPTWMKRTPPGPLTIDAALGLPWSVISLRKDSGK